MRNWKPGDIFSVPCPACGSEIEFFKDEMRVRCRSCHQLVPNPKLDPGCAEHCGFADQCVGPELARELREREKQRDR